MKVVASSNKSVDTNFTTVSAELGARLVEILNRMSVTTTFDPFFESIAEIIFNDISDVSKVLFYIVDHEIEMIQCLGEVDNSLKVKSGNEIDIDLEFIQDIHRGILGTSVETGKLTSTHPLNFGLNQIEILDKSEISVPIKFENANIGIIHVKRQTAEPFTERSKEKILFIANSIGGAIKSKLLTRQLLRSETKLSKTILDLKELSEFQEEIFRSLDEGLIVEDENLRIQYLNPKAEEVLGYTNNELRNKSYATIVANDSIFIVHTETKKQKLGERSSYRAKLLRKDESKIPVYIHASPFYREGNLKGIILVFTNLSLIVEIEEEILDLKEYQRRMLDNLPVGVIGITSNKKVGYINKYLQRLIGTSILGKPMSSLFSEFLKGSGSTSIIDIIDQSFDERTKFKTQEIPFVLQDKKVILNISLTPLLGYSDEFMGAMLVIEDDTASYTLIERLREASRELEERQDHIMRETQQKTEFQRELIKRTKALRQKNTEMESFVYSISHDLKTPIVSIQGFVAALIEDLGDSLNEEIKYYIERIKKNTDYSKRLILDILEYSKIGQENIAIQEVISLEIIQSAVKTIESQINYENFNVVIRPAPYPKIKCQPKRIHQVFINLVDNAVKYQDKLKENPKLEIFLEEEEKFWTFVFQDNGKGISESQLKRIFVMFERGYDEDSSDVIEGSGIGLAFSKKIVEIHNGQITVESKVGKGSTFRIWLPKTPSFQVDRIF